MNANSFLDNCSFNLVNKILPINSAGLVNNVFNASIIGFNLVKIILIVFLKNSIPALGKFGINVLGLALAVLAVTLEFSFNVAYK